MENKCGAVGCICSPNEIYVCERNASYKCMVCKKYFCIDDMYEMCAKCYEYIMCHECSFPRKNRFVKYYCVDCMDKRNN